ncbi:MAG TPA: hypothetical protein PLE59_00645 [Bacteroidales bacterium]|nr:hypothetical protein [Bacteroidales bacterium]HOK22352.1 hypothetical protein [Bacteroidales bacterium]HPL02004.1 hypothetical protein [Bacteroidales bacterium]
MKEGGIRENMQKARLIERRKKNE